MAEKTRKPQRPRLDAVIKHIKSGSYDEDMSQLKGAIEDRQRVRQQALLGQVKEVFGDDYEVVPPTKSAIEPPSPRQNPFFKGQQADPDLAEAEARARQEEAALRDSLGDDVEPGSDYESRSPIIGPGPAPAA